MLFWQCWQLERDVEMQRALNGKVELLPLDLENLTFPKHLATIPWSLPDHPLMVIPLPKAANGARHGAQLAQWRWIGTNVTFDVEIQRKPRKSSKIHTSKWSFAKLHRRAGRSRQWSFVEVVIRCDHTQPMTQCHRWKRGWHEHDSWSAEVLRFFLEVSLLFTLNSEGPIRKVYIQNRIETNIPAIGEKPYFRKSSCCISCQWNERSVKQCGQKIPRNVSISPAKLVILGPSEPRCHHIVGITKSLEKRMANICCSTRNHMFAKGNFFGHIPRNMRWSHSAGVLFS